MPKRIKIDWRKPGGKKPANTVVVARPSRWGNVFPWHDADFDVISKWRAKYIAQKHFRQWLDGDTIRPTNCTIDLPARRQWMLDHIGDLTGKNLACYCHLCDKHKDGLPIGEYCPDCDPCHGDVLGIMANDLA